MKDIKASVYEDLKKRILTMDLSPDESLDEATLSIRYGISRTPIREIFRLLEGEGYVDIRENRGARVVPMDYTRLRNFFQAAPLIYAAIGRLAAHHFTPKQLVELKDTQVRYRQATVDKDPSAMILQNNRFHAVMGEMSGNGFLQVSLDRLLIDHARIGYTVYRPHNEEMRRHLAQSVAEHDLFIEAIERRDEEAVASLVFDHWEPSRQKMEMYIAPQGLSPDRFTVIGH